MIAVNIIVIILSLGIFWWIARLTTKKSTTHHKHTGNLSRRNSNHLPDFGNLVKIESAEDRQLLKEAIAICSSGENWDHRRALWRNEPATEMQLAYLFDLGYAGTDRLSKKTASELIDRYLVARQYTQMREAREKKRARESMAQQRKEQKRNAKLDKLNNTPPRSKIMKATRAKWIIEFNELWNNILADGKISIREAEDLKAWLNSHRTVKITHEDFIAAIDRAAQDGIITGEESQDLYQGAIRLIETLGGSAEET